MAVRVYVQSEHFSDTKLVEIDVSATHEELRAACLAVLPGDATCSELMLLLEEDYEDAPESTGWDLVEGRPLRVHLHRSREVRVTVRFNGSEHQHEFSPSATVAKVKRWAVHEFGMTEADAAEHVLQVTGTSERPSVEAHIGSLAPFPHCKVSFDLVPAHRINGAE